MEEVLPISESTALSLRWGGVSEDRNPRALLRTPPPRVLSIEQILTCQIVSGVQGLDPVFVVLGL